MARLSFLDKERSVAAPGFNRWLVPPAALAIHLSIGQAYAFSVFKNPLSSLIPTSPPGAGANWTEAQTYWIFSIAIVFLGLSAAVFGPWLERAGPRKAMFAAACCFGGGFFISALGVHLHQLWLVYLGYGAIGGIGLGLGYISPVATLIRWFLDRPGTATGMAIMGFGGGALIGSPLATNLMAHFKATSPQGVVPTMMLMGVLYFCFMMFGAFLIRIPPPGWTPPGYTPPAKSNAMITSRSVAAGAALRTPQFWLLWLLLCLNTTAGIGIIEGAAPMVRNVFRGRVSEAAAGGFVGVLSLFNMGGRFFWSSISDKIGRKPAYMIFFTLGVAMYLLLPLAGSHTGNIVLFVALCGVILSMYGGGFATMPAYMKDLFGTRQVGPIYGRVLTAWSVAGVLGPMLVTGIARHQDAHGVPKYARYDATFYVMAGLLAVGFIANLLVRPVNQKYLMPEADAPAPPGPARESAVSQASRPAGASAGATAGPSAGATGS